MVTGKSPFARDDEADIEAAILAHTPGVLPSPPPVADDATLAGAAAAGASPLPSEALRDLCIALLNPAAAARLGSGDVGGIEGLQASAWFAGFDWGACLAMSLPAPSVPPPLDPMDADATLLELSRRCQQGFD